MLKQVQHDYNEKQETFKPEIISNNTKPFQTTRNIET